jgi:predicted esterase
MARQTTELPRGQVVESVVCTSDHGRSYALYLPSRYSPERTWPVLYAFDPRARGTVALERFKDAAERYGWIIVGSNDSRNGPFQPSVDAWNAMVKDTHERLAIDDERVYTAGFSGAARVAIHLATLCRDCIAGVIACGAGFPAGITPSPALHFAVFAAAGEEDFNYPELTDLDESLAGAGMPHRLEFFDGRHEWMPASVAADAVEWLELKAMQAGRCPPDGRVIDAVRQKTLERAEALERARKIHDAYRAYAGAADAFRGLLDVGDFERRAGQMRDRPELKDAIRGEQRQIRKQRDLEARIGSLIARGERRRAPETAGAQERGGQESTDSEQFAPEIQLHVLLADLRRQVRSVEASSDRQIARRVLDGAFISLYEQGLDFLRTQGLSARAVRAFTLATEVYPDRGGAFFYLACAHGAGGARKQALQALKNAVDVGFTDLSAITGNRALDLIRNDPQYEKIVARIGKSR